MGEMTDTRADRADINTLRQLIDDLDDDILRLLNRRMLLSPEDRCLKTPNRQRAIGFGPRAVDLPAAGTHQPGSFDLGGSKENLWRNSCSLS